MHFALFWGIRLQWNFIIDGGCNVTWYQGTHLLGWKYYKSLIGEFSSTRTQMAAFLNASSYSNNNKMKDWIWEDVIMCDENKFCVLWHRKSFISLRMCLQDFPRFPAESILRRDSISFNIRITVRINLFIFFPIVLSKSILDLCLQEWELVANLIFRLNEKFYLRNIWNFEMCWKIWIECQYEFSM